VRHKPNNVNKNCGAPILFRGKVCPVTKHPLVRDAKILSPFDMGKKAHHLSNTCHLLHKTMHHDRTQNPLDLQSIHAALKDGNGCNIYKFCLPKPVPNRVNQYPYPAPYPRMGRRSFPYPHILLKSVNIFSISTKIIISNFTQE
jgi:hypothetical protein